jgi:hypothetical protein
MNFSNTTALQRFSIGLLLFLVFLFTVKRVSLRGDVDEYALMTIALANHYSPDVQMTDVRQAQQLMPNHKAYLQQIADGIEAGRQVPRPGFYRGLNGKVYAIHFFAYSALAVLPFKFLQMLGREPLESLLLVNLSFIFVLGLGLFRFFGSSKKASLGLSFFFFCGGLNYLYWSGPETMSAAALCAALLFYVLGNYLSASILIGLAAMQNPPLILAVMFLPLLHVAMRYQSKDSLLQNLRQELPLRALFGGGIAVCALLLTMAFNWSVFAVPNIIVKVATSTDFISWQRLHSLFFDWNQGMIVGQLGIWLAICLLFFTAREGCISLARRLLLLVIAVCFSVSLAIPALSTGNWNSGAIGMMRYAFWGGMPLLFIFLFFLKHVADNNRNFVRTILFIQFICTVSAYTYDDVHHSPVAKLFLKFAPGLYNPEPEIFVERSLHLDGAELSPDKVFVFDDTAMPTKILFHEQNTQIDRILCGNQRALGSANRYANAGKGWHYLNAAVDCIATQKSDINTP